MILTPPRRSREIKVGSLTLGGGAPIRVQSMTSTDTRDAAATLAQIERLARAGCEIVRLAVPDEAAVEAFGAIRAETQTPLIADIHFDHRLALDALKGGADGVRVNPGNIGGESKLLRVAEEAAGQGACLRVGVNSGSLEADLLEKYGRPSPEALVASALRASEALEGEGFFNFKVSLKSSNALSNIEACLSFAAESEAPLHLGVTEAGPLIPGLVKSALGIGLLLIQGVGETIRVSLTADPVAEVKAAYEILRALGLRRRGVEIISCPTCGRCEIDLISLVEDVAAALDHIEEPLRVAVMGCVVNGPGEAKEAEVGVAGGRGQGLVFRAGQKLYSVPEDELVRTLTAEVEALVEE